MGRRALFHDLSRCISKTPNQILLGYLLRVQYQVDTRTYNSYSILLKYLHTVRTYPDVPYLQVPNNNELDMMLLFNSFCLAMHP